MADSGINWGAWAYATYPTATNWNDHDIADSANLTSEAIDLDVKAACNIGIKLVEDNTGAISGTVTVTILGNTGDDGGSADEYEAAGQGNPWSFEITPVQNATVRKVFPVDPRYYSKIKVYVANNSGQTLTTTLEVKTATIPAAS